MSTDWKAIFAEGLTYEEFLARHATADQKRLWERSRSAIALSDAQRSLLESFCREMKVLCLAGAWCGDCIEQCPIFDTFAQATPRIQLRFLDRDAHANLAESWRICGGLRVPVVYFLSESDDFIGVYGDRTLAKYRQLAADLAGPTCPTGIVGVAPELTAAVIADWLREFERCQLLLRTSPRLRQLHGD